MQRTQITFGGESVDRFPDLFRTKDGAIIMCYQSLSPGRFRWMDCRVRMRRSRDEGRTWSAPREVLRFRDIEKTVENEGLVINDFFRFARLPDGRIVMAGGIRRKETGLTGGGWWESRDEGETWQGPVIHGDIVARQITRPRLLRDGNLGLLAAGCASVEPMTCAGRTAYTYFAVSADGGKRWEKRSVLFDGDFFPAAICEPDWVVGPDGTIRVYARADCGYTPGAVYESRDDGRSWKTRPMTFLGHHLAADLVPGTDRAMVCFRACHYIWPPAVGAWLEDGPGWGRYLSIHQGVGMGRYQADVGQWVAKDDGGFLLAYAIRTGPEEETHIWTASFSTDEFVRSQLDTEGNCGGIQAGGDRLAQ